MPYFRRFRNSLVVSICRSVRPHRTTLSLNGFWWNLIIFRKPVEKLRVSLKMTRITGGGALHLKTGTHITELHLKTGTHITALHLKTGTHITALHLKTGTHITALHLKTGTHLWIYLPEFFLEWEMYQTKVVEKIETHFMLNNFFYRKSCRVCEATDTYSKYVILMEWNNYTLVFSLMMKKAVDGTVQCFLLNQG
jgi:hypothetical protein